MTIEDDMARATRLFDSFHHRAPRKRELLLLPAQPPVVVLAVGPQTDISYRALGTGIDYCHQFQLAAGPSVYVSADGLQIYTLGGGYRFTDRGFIGS